MVQEPARVEGECRCFFKYFARFLRSYTSNAHRRRKAAPARYGRVRTSRQAYERRTDVWQPLNASRRWWLRTCSRSRKPRRKSPSFRFDDVNDVIRSAWQAHLHRRSNHEGYDTGDCINGDSRRFFPNAGFPPPVVQPS